jgi:hypothetical protein
MLKSIMRKLVVTLTASAALVTAPIALADRYIDEHPDAAEMFADGLVVRPLGLGATVLGCATWLVTLPFSALGGNVHEATQKLVVQPATFTFVRPLGEF